MWKLIIVFYVFGGGSSHVTTTEIDFPSHVLCLTAQKQLAANELIMIRDRGYRYTKARTTIANCIKVSE